MDINFEELKQKQAEAEKERKRKLYEGLPENIIPESVKLTFL